MPAASVESDVADTPVPDSARIGRFALAMMWWGLCSALYYIFVGATLAAGYGVANALAAMALSVASFALLSAALVPFAIRTGMSVALLSQQLFGCRGALLVTLLLFMSTAYYAVFEGSVLAVAITRVFPALPYGFACVVVVLLAAPLTLGPAQRWLDKLNGVLLPLYLGGVALMVVLAARAHPGGNWVDLGPAHGVTGGWWPCYVAYMGLWLQVMVTLEFARFGRPRDTAFHTQFTFGVPFYAVTLLASGAAGAFLVATVGARHLTETSIVDITLGLLGGLGGLVFIWATQTRINLANFYLSSINLQALLDGVLKTQAPKWACVLAVAVSVAALMQATDIFSWILLALTWQGIFVTGWVSIAVTYLLLNRTAAAEGPAPAVRPAGLLAWGVAAVTGIALLRQPGLSGLATPAAALVAAATHLAFSRLLGPKVQSAGA